MKYFCYTYSENTPRNGHTQKTVKLYRIVRGVPKRVGSLTETFMDEFQIVMVIMETNKLLPAAAFEKNPSTGSNKIYHASAMRDAGYATVTRVW